MKTSTFGIPCLECCLIVATMFGTSAAQTTPAADAAAPGWLESGVHAKGLGYRPMFLTFSPALAGEIKKSPADLVSPCYGSFKTGPAEDTVTHLVIVDFTNGVPTRVFVDANGNGDLTDDPVSTVTPKEFELPDGTTSANDTASATVDLTSDGKTRGAIEFYNVRADISKPAVIPRVIGYYHDFGLAGEVMLGGKSVPTLLSDDTGTTRFTSEGGPRTASLLWIDVNGNGKVDRGESMPSCMPFEADGKWWKVSSMTPEGVIQVAETERPAQAKAEISKLDPGNKAPAFTAKTTDGKEIRFPDDYRGKVVLIDFWATWCGPCIAELPNVIQAYGIYHEKGMEVLGVSLDKEGMAEKLTAFTAKKGMPWPQIYDGKFWNAEVATLYGIHAIPHMILVDGDSGVIIADKTIRGEALAPAIEKALSSRK